MSIWQIPESSRVFDLAQPYFVGMPHHPAHPPFLFGLVKQHGDYVGPAQHSSASDALALGSHVGTHIDALCHFSCGGKLYGGDEASDVQSYAGGLQRHSIDTIAPILRRGVLLDIVGLQAGLEGGALPADFEITPGHLEAAVRAAGHRDPPRRRSAAAHRMGDLLPRCPALYQPGARPRSRLGRRPMAQPRRESTRRDRTRWPSKSCPTPHMPVHVHLLVESGIHIIECLNLEELARARVYEFLFVALPLKLTGATASPIRPVAVG